MESFLDWLKKTPTQVCDELFGPDEPQSDEDDEIELQPVNYEELEDSEQIPVSDPGYWAWRLDKAQKSGFLHKVLYYVPLNTWRLIERRHRQILRMKIGNNDSILDIGCAWGRLLDLLLTTWDGEYLGIDVAPSLIELARKRYPSRKFILGDMRTELTLLDNNQFEWAVLISIRDMIIRGHGQGTWDEIERELKRVTNRILYLEYDPSDTGRVE